MTPEDALVLLLGRLTFDNLTKVRIFNIVKNGVDWYKFLNICVKRKLICMVYKSLTDLEIIQLLPMIIINNMQYHYEQNQEQNRKFLKVSAPIISYFNNNDILAVPVKGIRFLNTIYSKELGVRILSDIDFIASSKNQSDIHCFMKQSGYNTYLVNNKDVFCSTNTNVKSYFYIKFDEKNSYGKLRIDFDFGYPDDLIQKVQSSEQPVYEFLYLCNSYYEETYNIINSKNIATYNYVKLIDIHEYYSKYLSAYAIKEIFHYADKINSRKQLMFILDCLEALYTDVFHS